MGFKKGFVWGAASASYQIEGAYKDGGKGLSVWDTFTRKENTIFDKSNGDVACDHIRLYKEDVSLMKQIGLQAYRFSISWPRVINFETGKVNPEGIGFYDRLVDELIANGVDPWATLFHWDFPYALYKQGGWLNPSSSDWFADYSRIVAEKLSDRVKNWFTLNEPHCFVNLGHKDGIHAPGDKLGMKQIFEIIHNALLAHGKGVQAIRNAAKSPVKIGFAPPASVCCPATNSPRDIDAAVRGNFTGEVQNIWSLDLWLDPVYKGNYSDDTLSRYAEFLPEIKDGDMKTISQNLDYCGVNIYQGFAVSGEENNQIKRIYHDTGYARTAIGWPVVPESLYWGAKFLYERYGKPIVIAENGMSSTDWVFRDGCVHDAQRIDFLERYLSSLKKAADEGVPVDGYFHWSLTDNFEWAYGYTERFGLIYVDYKTQKRTLKDSALWYKKVIETNGDAI